MIRPPEAQQPSDVYCLHFFSGPVMLWIFLEGALRRRGAAFFGRVQMKGSSVTKRVVDSRTFLETPSLYFKKKLLVLLCGGAIVTTHKEQRCSGENDTCAHLFVSSEGIALRPPPPHDLSFVTEKNGEYPLPSDEIRNSRHCGLPRAHTHTRSFSVCVAARIF